MHAAFLLAAAAWASGLTALAIKLLTYATHSAHSVPLLLAAPVAGVLLAAISVSVVPRLCSRRDAGRRDDLQRQIAFCLSPMLLSWLWLFPVQVPVSATTLTWAPRLVLLAMGMAIAAAIAWGSTSWPAAARDARGFFAGSTTGRRLASWSFRLWIPLLCVFLFSQHLARHLQRPELDDSCEFGGDVWEYQSIAVNWALGHGFPVFGGIEAFATYRFGLDQDKQDPELLARFEAAGAASRDTPQYTFYRAPLYPLFLGTIYRLYGVSPAAAKRVQVCILAAIAACLPLLGFMHWRWHGLLGSVLAGDVLLERYQRLPGYLITENLIMLWAFLFLVAFAIWHRRRNAATAIVLGVVIGTGLLVKGWFVFLLPIFLIYLGSQVIARRLRASQPLLMLLAMTLCVAPWSLYASAKAGHLVVLSTQASVLLRDCNNERVMFTGGWEHDWVSDPSCFYQRPDISPLSIPQQVILFYIQNLERIPAMIALKLKGAFAHFPNLMLVMVTVCATLLRRVLAPPPGAPLPPGARILTLRVTALSLLALVAYAFTTRQSPVSLFVTSPTALLLTVTPLLLLPAWWRRGDLLPIPPAFTMVFANVLLVNIVCFGYDRFTWPVDLVLLLVGFSLGIRLLTESLLSPRATLAST